MDSSTDLPNSLKCILVGGLKLPQARSKAFLGAIFGLTMPTASDSHRTRKCLSSNRFVSYFSVFSLLSSVVVIKDQKQHQSQNFMKTPFL